MGKIFIVMGKSASGKDHIYAKLIRKSALKLKPLVIYTTRPMRSGEKNGKEYYFTDVEHMNELRDAKKIIEERVYHTVHGDWYYFTADEGQLKENKSYMGIGTLESYVKLKEYFGEDRVVPIYIQVSDMNRLLRSIKRESKQASPEYKEVCRRFLADEEDFSEEKVENAGITERFSNDGKIIDCVKAITEYILARK